VEMVKAMKERGCLNRVLLSHDAGWYSVSEPRGGGFRPFDTLFTRFVPALNQMSFTEVEIRQPLVRNPSAAFSCHTRLQATVP
jgi:phosphotriesterase-related protein